VSKTAILIVGSLVIGIIITAVTYFVAQSQEVFPSGEAASCATPLASENILGPVKTERGLPAKYVKTSPSSEPGGICGGIPVYKTSVSYRNLGLDLIGWSLLGFVITYAGLHFAKRRGHARHAAS
jgi:hypothetical protein